MESIKAVIDQKHKISHLLLSTIISDFGLKQGDNLSPIEFNLFFNDVDEIFDETCDPLPIDSERKICHLSFADDLAMFSLSKAGLQKCLNNLLTYFNKWGLKSV